MSQFLVASGHRKANDSEMFPETSIVVVNCTKREMLKVPVEFPIRQLLCCHQDFLCVCVCACVRACVCVVKCNMPRKGETNAKSRDNLPLKWFCRISSCDRQLWF
jgi:hypothetical protein